MKTERIDIVGAMPQDEFDAKILPVLMTIDKWKLPDCIRKMEEAVARLLNNKRKLKRREKKDRQAETRREARQRRRTERRLEAAGKRIGETKTRAAEYKDYLQSPQWQQIRAEVIQRDDGKCKACGRTATQVHHRKYDKRTMNGETLKWLVALCGGCHSRIHFKDGVKLKRRQVEAELKVLIAWSTANT